MRATAMVVIHPLVQNPSEVMLVERDEPVQTLPADGPDEPFTKRVGVSCRLHR